MISIKNGVQKLVKKLCKLITGIDPDRLRSESVAIQMKYDVLWASGTRFLDKIASSDPAVLKSQEGDDFLAALSSSEDWKSTPALTQALKRKGDL